MAVLVVLVWELDRGEAGGSDTERRGYDSQVLSSERPELSPLGNSLVDLDRVDVIKGPRSPADREGLQASARTLIVRVLGALDDRPLAGAWIRVNWDTVDTREVEPGVLHYDLKPGESIEGVSLQVYASGYVTRRYALRLEEYEPVVRLEPARLFEVQVVDAVTGLARPGVAVSGSQETEVQWRNLKERISDRDGRATLELLNPSAQLRVFVGGRWLLPRTIEVEDLAAQPLRVAIGGKGEIRGHVLDPSSGERLQVSIVVVTTQAPNGPTELRVRAEEGRSFRVTDLPLNTPFELLVHVVGEEGQPLPTAPITLTEEQPLANLSLTLAEVTGELPKTLRVNVLSDDGAPWKWGSVWIRAVPLMPQAVLAATSASSRGSSTSVSGGRPVAELELGSPGTYRVFAEHDDWILDELTLDWPIESEATLTIETGGAIAVRVKQRGMPVEGAQISVQAGGHEPSWWWDSNWNLIGSTDERGELWEEGYPRQESVSLLVEAGLESVQIDDVRPGSTWLEIELPEPVTVTGRLPGTQRGHSLECVLVSQRGWQSCDLILDLGDRFELRLQAQSEARDLWFYLPRGAYAIAPLPPCDPGERIDLGDITVADGLVFEGRLMDDQGTPLAGIQVGCVSPLDAYWPETLTQPDGSFRLEGLPDRGLGLYASPKGYAWLEEEPFRVHDSPRTFVLTREAYLSVDPGPNRPSARIIALQDGATSSNDLCWFRATEDDRQSAWLASGTWRLWIQDSSASPWVELETISLAPGEQRSLTPPR